MLATNKSVAHHMFPRIPSFPTIKMSFADLFIVVFSFFKTKKAKKRD